LHDPQTAGLVPVVKELGVPVVWRAHIGVDHAGELARSAWHFLNRYVSAADICVFSRPAYVWDGIQDDRVVCISPSIDPFSPKNEDLDEQTVAAILGAAQVTSGASAGAAPRFTKMDGTAAEVRRAVSFDRERALSAGEPYVLQVSRWDALKDPRGVI